MEKMYREIIERAGARFIKLENNVVFFAASADERVLRLFAHACSAENVALTVKNSREAVKDFEALMPTE